MEGRGPPSLPPLLHWSKISTSLAEPPKVGVPFRYGTRLRRAYEGTTEGLRGETPPSLPDSESKE